MKSSLFRAMTVKRADSPEGNENALAQVTSKQ